MKTILLLTAFLFVSINHSYSDNMGQNYYCEYCGHKFPTVRLLVNDTCHKHPNGSHRGYHKLYEGSEKSKYTCKYCGHQFITIMQMVNGTCPRHPNGGNKGYHAPAL